MKRRYLSSMIVMALCVGTSTVWADAAADATDAAAPAAAAKEKDSAAKSAASTSNTTTANETKRMQELEGVTVNAASLSLGGGMMSVQSAPKAVSTITREAIEKASPGSNFTQMIATIPGINSATDDVTGLANGYYSLRGFDSSDIGMTLNGAPITDSGSYSVYATEYGDSENMGDITVLQGIPDVDMPDSGASGGHIGWATIDPTHNYGVDYAQSLGSNNYYREFLRVNTGDIGPVRSWLSYSKNTVDKWRGDGNQDVTKVDGKSLWTINDDNSVSASLQYNRQVNYNYRALTKAQEAQYGYYYDYATTWLPGTSSSVASANANYWRLRSNPYRSAILSLDGEFKITDDWHVSVIPYYEYLRGGGGSGSSITENATAVNTYGSTTQDINGDGITGTSAANNNRGAVYSYSAARTDRPGVIVKFNNDFGQNDSLEYGFWYEQSRKSQSSTYGLVDSQGNPADLWSYSSYITYANGEPQRSYLEYTNTEVKKGFITNNFTPNDQWTFVLGVSYLWENRNGWVYEYPNSSREDFSNVDQTWHKVLPTAGIKFQLNEQNQFYIGTGKTFRLPTNTAVFLNTLVGIPGGANDKPEQAWNTDIGYRFYGEKVSVSADIYNSNYSNKQQSGYDTTTGYTYYVTVNKMHMRGFNGEVSYSFFDSWKAYLSYTYTQAKIVGDLNTYGDGIYPTDGKQMPATPKNIGNIGVMYDDKSLWGSVFLRSTSSQYGDYVNTESVGGFTTLNFSGGVHLGDWGWLKKPYVQINATNITDRKAFSYVSGATFAATKAFPTYTSANYISSPTYGLLQPAAFVLTFGGSFN